MKGIQERPPKGQSWNSRRNKISGIYAPKYKINAHEPILVQIDDRINKWETNFPCRNIPSNLCTLSSRRSGTPVSVGRTVTSYQTGQTVWNIRKREKKQINFTVEKPGKHTSTR